MKTRIGRLLGFPDLLSVGAPFWPLLGALLCRWMRMERLEARWLGSALARSIVLARDPSVR